VLGRRLKGPFAGERKRLHKADPRAHLEALTRRKRFEYEECRVPLLTTDKYYPDGGPPFARDLALGGG
jgi:hypothetical protein